MNWFHSSDKVCKLFFCMFVCVRGSRHGEIINPMIKYHPFILFYFAVEYSKTLNLKIIEL